MMTNSDIAVKNSNGSPNLEKKEKVKEADLYSAFIEVPYTQGAQVRITQCYPQTTPYPPLPRKHSPDGASQTEVANLGAGSTNRGVVSQDGGVGSGIRRDPAEFNPCIHEVINLLSVVCSGVASLDTLLSLLAVW